MLDGSKSTSGGGQTTIIIPADTAQKTWLQLGRMVLVEHDKLPSWAGMIDTPWQATAPINVTLYNAAYLLSLRTPDQPVTYQGTVYGIASQVIDAINAQEEMYLRVGIMAGDDISRKILFDQTSYWQRLNEMVALAGKEMYLRPDIVDGRLIIYVDIQDRAGIDTGYLLHDGANANMQISSAKVDGKIINRLIGTGGQNTKGSRVTSSPAADWTSIDTYRLRSGVNQYQNITDLATLNSITALDLAYSAWPRLVVTMNILDVGDTFYQLQPGNTFLVQASKLYLPGGDKGWRGTARLTALAYDEASNTVGATLEAQYGQ